MRQAWKKDKNKFGYNTGKSLFSIYGGFMGGILFAPMGGVAGTDIGVSLTKHPNGGALGATAGGITGTLFFEGFYDYFYWKYYNRGKDKK